MRASLLIAALLLVAFCAKAEALDLTDDLSVTGYGDLRVIAPTGQQSWLKGGLGKFRYGSAQNIGGEGVAQADWAMAPGWSAVSVLRAEPEDRNVVDALETYLRYARRARVMSPIASRPGPSSPPSRWKMTTWAGPAPTR